MSKIEENIQNQAEENLGGDNTCNKNDDSCTCDSENSIEKIKQEREEYLDGWKRAKAELINYKSDELKRISEIARFAGEDIICDVINVLDSFDLCIVAINEKDPSIAKGVYMIRTQLEDLLKKRGLERIMVSVGHIFDPALHEAISTVSSDKPSGTIIDEMEKGYMWHGKLLRPARVVIAK